MRRFQLEAYIFFFFFWNKDFALKRFTSLLKTVALVLKLSVRMLCSSTEKKDLACYFYNKNNDSWEYGLTAADGNVIKSSGIMIEKRKLAIVKWLIQ